jgi:hypothetical protein
METFLVFDPEDPQNASVCFGEVEARKVIDCFGGIDAVHVRRVTLDHISRDVTVDFAEPEIASEYVPRRRTRLVSSVGDWSEHARRNGR